MSAAKRWRRERHALHSEKAAFAYISPSLCHSDCAHGYCKGAKVNFTLIRRNGQSPNSTQAVAGKPARHTKPKSLGW